MTQQKEETIMLYLNPNEEKRLVFEVEIHGVETKDLNGSVRFLLHGVEYGFPVDIEPNRIVALIPPLTEVIGRRDIEDGILMEAKLEVYTDRSYFRPWKGEIKLSAPIQIKAKLENEDKTRVGVKVGLVNSVLVEDIPPVKKTVKKETISYENKEQVPTNEGETLKRAVAAVMKEMGLMNPPASVAPAQKKAKIVESIKPTQKKVIEPPVQQVKKQTVKPTEEKTQQEAIHDFIQEKLMSISKPFQPVRQAKKVITKEDIMNVTEDQIYIYMEKAGTKNPDVQKIIYEQASQGAVNNYDILKNVVKIIKRKK